MSRYVDADALEYDTEWSEYHDGFTAYSQMAIDTAPSIDIVFCEECKYEPICNHSVQHTTHDAYSVTIGSKTVEWCSYGEREGE